MANPDALATLAWCGAIVGVAVVISSLETLFSWRNYATGAIFDGRQLARLTVLDGSGLARRLLGWLFTTSALRALAALRLICGIVLLMPNAAVEVRAVTAAAAFLTGGVLVWRNRFGTDGSDQMTAIVLAGVAVGSFFHSSEFAVRAAITFIAIQGCLAYGVAGVAKALSPFWRSGAVIGAIMETETWGSRQLAPWLVSSRQASLLASWTVIVAECAFPAVVIAPSWLVAALLGWGIAFHVFCAVTMGLNTFFWAFVSAYPAILYVRALVLGSLR
jgi:hypothetical protein